MRLVVMGDSHNIIESFEGKLGVSEFAILCMNR